MNAYLFRIYFKTRTEPQERWAKAENFGNIEKNLPKVLDGNFRKVELLQSIKNIDKK